MRPFALQKNISQFPESIELKRFIQTSDYTEFKTLHECNDMLIKGMKNTGKDCLILFTGAAHRLGKGIEINDDWLDKIGIKNSSVFLVSDLKKSWSNCINIDILKNTFYSFGRFDRTIALGTSMGGTNALLLGPSLGAETIIAFGPQYSMHPDYVSQIIQDVERKTKRNYFVLSTLKAAENISNWKYKCVDDLPYSNANEYIFFGDSFHDLAQAELFFNSEVSRSSCITLQHVGHDCAASFSEKGILEELVGLCISRSRTNELVNCLNSGGFVVAQAKSRDES
uniref:hypothetical protein n=1 Tax=Synechococcus sp. UW106 TaxID=368495 RepID=UPI000E0F673D|nr:hypothetical protein [Synechococcus sp. UW106]